ncbi:TetR/AcrR family transcriptional regulator [Rhizobium sp. BR 314]|uniref:TetR/AcrR family transcriptional regulator n=1 Tax=Rhizobium sp. BR 314 TaxID=3040013 RepID=UPI0039BF913E
MPRHKTISDERLLDILVELIVETGPDGLTFARSAKACGLSPAALVQRYGDRETLVEAILMQAWEKLQAETAAADAEAAPTPEGAVNLLMRLMPPETAEHDATDGLLLLREDIRNPKLRARGAAWLSNLANALGRRLSDNPKEANRLGWEMVALWQGAHTVWAFTRQETAAIAIRRMLNAWLARL